MPDSLDQEIHTLQSIFWSERDPEGLAFAPLADAFRRKGEVREALDLLTDGMSRHPDYATGHVIATRLYLDQGMSSEAEISARRVLELDAENLVALSAMTSVLAERGELGGAARHRTLLMSVDPESEEARAVADLDLEAQTGPAVDEAPRITDFEIDTGSGSEEVESLLDDLTIEPLLEPGADAEIAELEAELPEVVDLATLAPDEPEDEEIVELADLAPDEPATEEVVDLADLAPDEPEAEEVVDLADLAPDAAEDDTVDLKALAPDEPDDGTGEAAVDLAELAWEADETSLDLVTDEADDVTDDDDVSEPIYTRTLAELYIKQGFTDKALEVLKALYEMNPHATDLADRIEALEKGELDDLDALGPSVPTASPVGSSEEGHSEAEVEARARELAEQGLEDSDEVDTPFAWSEPEEAPSESDTDDEGEPAVGSYFDRLLAWEDRDES